MPLSDVSAARDLEHGEQVARVAFGAVDEMLERVVVDREVLVAEPAVLVGERALQQDAQVVVAERLEPEQRASARAAGR